MCSSGQRPGHVPQGADARTTAEESRREGGVLCENGKWFTSQAEVGQKNDAKKWCHAMFWPAGTNEFWCHVCPFLMARLVSFRSLVGQGWPPSSAMAKDSGFCSIRCYFYILGFTFLGLLGILFISGVFWRANPRKSLDFYRRTGW